ncbi:hypothetical protein OIU77_015070 [Salix suchowensis]|uniref:Uncharacterized protein n=1 Tax=Salix suchowensis TaxID=1278906 RepID=A0ABQ8ZZH7_9ROSI|nr:hypothetical protein OIU77_015070 [Salix suchowensis]
MPSIYPSLISNHRLRHLLPKRKVLTFPCIRLGSKLKNCPRKRSPVTCLLPPSAFSRSRYCTEEYRL